ncbi:hypothetical protein LSG31_09140 [Fodinisporobacter ferrooxydans]|uniref:Uncharacterized protein n=1 Tax=Fodinisporobacter ferrooxydans TaxID=2901836 RepID=A0ABY4CP77_9BACL|nr:hypothetical protein LSG31_09140 [Alicyclobacillaceae bacterium MYW30-H2]
MALSFSFAMLVELTTGSKTVGAIITLVTIGIASIWITQRMEMLDMVEVILSVVMGVAMGIMFIGMLSDLTILVIQIGLLATEFLFLVICNKSSLLRG